MVISWGKITIATGQTMTR